MSTYALPRYVTVSPGGSGQSICFLYAVRECLRLLRKAGVEPEGCAIRERSDVFYLQVGQPGAAVAAGILPKHDGFSLSVSKDGVVVAASTAKGVLNGVYFLAEQLGYLFLLPGESGEWAPGRVRSLPLGETVMQPRFPYHGVFWLSLSTQDYSVEEWLRFYAKLKFNALSHEVADLPLAEELGIRLEVGGHGLSKLLPRDRFADHPEWFRLFQPEDFGGKRFGDANFCVTNPEARGVVKASFAEELQAAQGVYAIHAWADDLPAGGWCLCPACRSFSPADQAMLAMNLLAEAARERGSPVRIANLAYHDTLYPGANITPDPRCFLLFAPRERCYGHAIDDPGCRRNRFYLEALKSWQAKCACVPDSHTFEYYFDQILFRGMYPFLPDVIVKDMAAYQAHGISTHLALQVAGPALAPEFNMLLFAAACWDDRLTAPEFCRRLSARLADGGAPAWEAYLLERGAVFADALRLCEHDMHVYLDYRWLPEALSSFAREMANAYAEASERLRAAAARLAAGTSAQVPNRLIQLTRSEVARASFEAVELQVMHHQQCAVNGFADYLNAGSPGSAAKGCEHLAQALSTLQTAKAAAVAFGLPVGSWYFGNINTWLAREFTHKMTGYRRLLAQVGTRPGGSTPWLGGA